jgi:hypothetical protein
MTIMIKGSARYTSAVAGQALSLAIRIETLADEIGALQCAIRAARYELVRRAGFHCDTAVGWLKHASPALQEATDHLERVADAIRPGACAVSLEGARVELREEFA